MKTGKVILLCGLPGSGKTTLAKQLEEEQGVVRFSPDDWMEDMGISLWDNAAREVLEQRFWKLAQELAQQGVVSVLENGFWSKQERESYLMIARQKGFRIELRVLHVPKYEARKRLQLRGMEGDSLIINEKLDEYYELFDLPTKEELAQYDNQ